MKNNSGLVTLHVVGGHHKMLPYDHAPRIRHVVLIEPGETFRQHRQLLSSPRVTRKYDRQMLADLPHGLQNFRQGLRVMTITLTMEGEEPLALVNLSP